MTKKTLLGAAATLAALISIPASAEPFGGRNGGLNFDGAVYAMSNDTTANTIVAYGRFSNGKLKFIGEFATGGRGSTDFDGPEGLDPLISGDSLVLSDDRRFLFAVNTGSNTVSSFIIRPNLEPVLVDTISVDGVAPNSIAYRDGVIYVTSIDADGVFTGEPDQEGAFEAFRVGNRGQLRSIRNSRRVLENRPSNIRVAPNGRFLTVTSINAGSAALASGSTDEIVSFGLQRNGRPTARAIDGATSTLPGNPQGRNLPSAISHEIVEADGRTFVVVTEAREFTSEGAPPNFPGLQAGSVSSWEINDFGKLIPVSLDVVSGVGLGERTTCWLEFSDDGEEFWASNTIDSNISIFNFDRGVVSFSGITADAGTVVNRTDPEAAFGSESDGFIDMVASDNGDYLYQLLGLRGGINVYKTEDDGELTLVQEVTGDLPVLDTQGIVAF